MAIIGISGKISSGKDTVGKIIQYLTCKSIIQEIFTFEEWLSNHTKNPNLEIDTSWQIKKFAYAVKQVCSILTGIPVEDFEKEEVKNKILGNEFDIKSVECKFKGTREEWFEFKTEMQDVDSSFKESFEYPIQIGDGIYQCKYFKTQHITVREFLQKVGTDAIRNVIHPDTWVIALMNQYRPTKKENGFQRIVKNEQGYPIDYEYEFNYPNWIITDLRFPNEYNAIEQQDGIMIRVERNPIRDCNICNLKSDCKLMFKECNGTNKAQTIPHSSETALDDHGFNYIIDNNGSIEELIEKVKKILINENIL